MTTNFDHKNNCEFKNILIALRVVGRILRDIDDSVDQLKFELVKHADDPFDVKKIMRISEQRLFYEYFGKNPLHAWEAIRLCQQYQFSEQPLWAYNAVFKSAEAITRLGSAEGSADSAIKKAIGIDGHKISQFEDNMFWLEVFHEVRALTKSGIAQKAAFLQVSKRYRGKAGSEDNVEKRYFAISKLLEGVVLPRPFDP